MSDTSVIQRPWLLGGQRGGLPPSLDLKFLGAPLDPRITFTRASTATYFDSSGVMQTAATNAPRFDCDPVTLALRGLLMEDARTNLLLNSATLGTQSVAVTAQAYTLSFYGTGTITKSGTAAGALVGAGAFPQRVSQQFTPTAGTLTLTVTGSVLNAQLEAGSFVSSYIPTAGATATRAVELAVITPTPWLNQNASTLASDYTVAYPTVPAAFSMVSAQIDNGNNNNILQLRNVPATQVNAQVVALNVSTGVAIAGLYTANTLVKHIAAFDCVALTAATTMNGAVPTGFSITSVPTGLNRLQIGSGRQQALNGWLQRVQYWSRVLSNAELQAVTR